MGVREGLGVVVLGSIGEEEPGAPDTEVLGGTWMRGSREHREWGRQKHLVAEEKEQGATGGTGI